MSLFDQVVTMLGRIVVCVWLLAGLVVSLVYLVGRALDWWLDREDLWDALFDLWQQRRRWREEAADHARNKQEAA